MDTNNMNNNVDNNTNYNTTDYNNTNYNNTNYTNTNYTTGNYNMGYNNVNGMNTGYAPSPVIQQNHRIRGVLGALVGALLGGILWTIIGCFGYISGYIAILIFVLASAGYAKLNGKQDTFGIIISLIFGLLTIIPATYCAFAYNALKALSDGVHSHFSYWEVLVDLPLYMDRYDWWGEFGGSLAKGYIFTIVVAIFFVVDSLKKKK